MSGEEKKCTFLFSASGFSETNVSYLITHISQYLLAPLTSKYIQSIRRGTNKGSLKVRWWMKNPQETDTGCQTWSNCAVHRKNYYFKGLQFLTFNQYLYHTLTELKAVTTLSLDI